MRVAGRRTSGVAILAFLAIAPIVVGACGSPTPTPSPTRSAAVPSPLATAPIAFPTATQSSLNGASHGASHAPTGIDPDPSLLDLVPTSEAGATLTYDPETTASVAADPTLVADVNYLAIGLARPTGAAADDPNLAIVNVVRLRHPGVTTQAEADAWFRAWRDTYDGAACAQAGGVARHAETDVAGVRVFIGGCANGSFTYHARIADGAMILSITSVGPDDLGRKIVEKLHS